ncbi:hypothetical protein GGR56DRAFT_692242 [Xylariaceae sp. FL0804]|nr:hypothetical protein GGR56DRAFT_692242 [Xylariaceae sp. FL0804]
MKIHRGLVVCLKAAMVALIHAPVAVGFSWRGGQHAIRPGGLAVQGNLGSGASQPLKSVGHASSSYELALDELQELESEPLCHRTAARLLVDNCQLLEGRDEATVLTDSGHKIRDFVDSFAASLAICDLERGSFVIPRECAKFRETELSQLALLNTAHLHVTSREIDACLSGLGASDSAWNTWVSYRHKALRFCEAARVDNDRAQNILLFERLTNIMSRLADDVDEGFGRRMDDIDHRTQATSDKIESLSPQLERLQEGLKSAEHMLSSRLLNALQESTDSIQTGIANADNLQKMLELILKGAVDGHTGVAAAHEHSLQVQARNMTDEILDVLEDTATSAYAVKDSADGRSSSASWWPYIWCPAASLVMGSYGLPPSAARASRGAPAPPSRTARAYTTVVGRAVLINLPPPPGFMPSTMQPPSLHADDAVPPRAVRARACANRRTAEVPPLRLVMTRKGPRSSSIGVEVPR